MGKACYCLALRPPVGPMCIPKLTFRLLEPLRVFVVANFKSLLQCSSLEQRNVFQTVFVFQREHCIFLESVDWCHILLHKEGT